MFYLDHIINKMDKDQLRFALEVRSNPDSIEKKEEYAKWYCSTHDLDDKLLIEAEQEITNFYPNGIQNRNALLSDIIASNMLYGASPLEFLQYKFEEKTSVARNTYMTDAEKFIVFRPFYDFAQYEYVRNKWMQYSRLSALFGRDCVRCEEPGNVEDIARFARFVEKHPTFVFKPTRLSCGEGVRIVNANTKNFMNSQELYDSLVKQGGGIADEKIEQDIRIGKFHTNSVNTVRIVGIRDNIRHRSFFTQAILRMGRGKEIIDNYIGAIRSRIDIDTGVAYTFGIDGNGNKFIFHPDSNEKIVGFEIPDWDKMLDVADAALSLMEEYARYIGFDFALSTDGWKIVEVNPFPQIYPQQMTAQEGSRPELLRYITQCKEDKKNE